MNEPNNPDYLANFAKSRQKMGDVAGAEQYFRQALTVAPDHQPSYHGLAEVMLTQGRGQEAQAMLSTWAGTQPYSPDAHVELAWLQHEMGNTQGQRSLCSRPCKSIRTTPQRWLTWGSSTRRWDVPIRRSQCIRTHSEQTGISPTCIRVWRLCLSKRELPARCQQQPWLAEFILIQSHDSHL